MPIACETLSLDDAKRMLAVAEDRASELGIAYCVAVLDAGGQLLAFSRQDGSRKACIDLAIGKAATARLFEMSTAELADLAALGAPFHGITEFDGGKVVAFGGGIPVTRKGSIVGAIGASAGTVEQDILVAQAAIAELGWPDQPAAAA